MYLFKRIHVTSSVKCRKYWIKIICHRLSFDLLKWCTLSSELTCHSPHITLTVTAYILFLSILQGVVTCSHLLPVLCGVSMYWNTRWDWPQLLFSFRDSNMNNEKAAMGAQERQLPSKGNLSLHQHALFLFWMSVVLTAFFRLIILKFCNFKVSPFQGLRMTMHGKCP